MAVKRPHALINTHQPLVHGPCKFKACELCQTLGAWALMLQAIAPCAEEGLATWDYSESVFVISHQIKVMITYYCNKYQSTNMLQKVIVLNFQSKKEQSSLVTVYRCKGFIIIWYISRYTYASSTPACDLQYHKTEKFWHCYTLAKPDSKNFDKRNFDEMLVKALVFVLYWYAYFAWWLYFERLKFSDLTPISQICQSFHSS